LLFDTIDNDIATTVSVTVTTINIGSKVSSKKNDTTASSSNDSAEETDGDGDDLITLLPLIQQCLAPPTSSSSDSNNNDTAVAAIKRCRDTNTPFGRPIDSPLIHTYITIT